MADSTGFVQIIEFHTKDFASLEKLHEGWLAATTGRRTVRREVLGRDRADPDRYLVWVEFASPEEAMRNSELPETSELAGRMAALCDRPPTFTDLDVVRVD